MLGYVLLLLKAEREHVSYHGNDIMIFYTQVQAQCPYFNISACSHAGPCEKNNLN